MPSGYAPGQYGSNLGPRPDLNVLPSHSSLPGSHLPNIPHDLASATAQELGTRPGELTHADSLSKSIHSNSELNDIDLATSLAEDLLKQFTDNSDKAISSGSELHSSQDSKNLPSGSSVHSASASAGSEGKVSSLEQLLDLETARCDEELSKFSSLPKLNIHMTGEQVIRACQGIGRLVFITHCVTSDIEESFHFSKF